MEKGITENINTQTFYELNALTMRITPVEVTEINTVGYYAGIFNVSYSELIETIKKMKIPSYKILSYTCPSTEQIIPVKIYTLKNIQKALTHMLEKDNKGKRNKIFRG